MYGTSLGLIFWLLLFINAALSSFRLKGKFFIFKIVYLVVPVDVEVFSI
jgi:hypothetical protein